jgi:DNA-binding IclR family transcriptional regulator
MVPDDLPDERILDDPAATKVLTRLVQAGYSPVTMARVLDVPVEELLDRLPRDVADGVIADDEMLRRGVRAVAWRVVSEMMALMDHGSQPVRMAVIRALGPKLAALLADDDRDHLADLRQDFARLVSELQG